MQLIQNENAFDARGVEEILRTENRFITDVFSILSLPTRSDDVEAEDEDVPQFKTFSDKPRASSLTELQQRLHNITSKKKLTYKDKMTKKTLKNRMKKKTKHDKRKAQQKLVHTQKVVKSEMEEQSVKSESNTDNKMVFSKIDFPNTETNKKEKKQEKDPKKLLEKLEKRKEHLEELAEHGDVQKVVEINAKQAWKSALAKAQGEKVKDDAILLKKSVKRIEQKKRASKKKWDKRLENVEKKKEERQSKRRDNIEKRKKDKKNNKLKKAVKKGKVIPGF